MLCKIISFSFMFFSLSHSSFATEESADAKLNRVSTTSVAATEFDTEAKVNDQIQKGSYRNDHNSPKELRRLVDVPLVRDDMDTLKYCHLIATDGQQRHFEPISLKAHMLGVADSLTKPGVDHEGLMWNWGEAVKVFSIRIDQLEKENKEKAKEATGAKNADVDQPLTSFKSMLTPDVFKHSDKIKNFLMSLSQTRDATTLETQRALAERKWNYANLQGHVTYKRWITTSTTEKWMEIENILKDLIAGQSVEDRITKAFPPKSNGDTKQENKEVKASQSSVASSVTPVQQASSTSLTSTQTTATTVVASTVAQASAQNSANKPLGSVSKPEKKLEQVSTKKVAKPTASAKSSQSGKSSVSRPVSARSTNISTSGASRTPGKIVAPKPSDGIHQGKKALNTSISSTRTDSVNKPSKKILSRVVTNAPSHPAGRQMGMGSNTKSNVF